MELRVDRCFHYPLEDYSADCLAPDHCLNLEDFPSCQFCPVMMRVSMFLVGGEV